MEKEIKVRVLAEKFFDEQVRMIEDAKRKEEVELEAETYIGIWVRGFRAGEQQPAGSAVWIKASAAPPICNPVCFAKIKDNLVEDNIRHVVLCPDARPGHWIAFGLQLRISVTLDKIIEWLDESNEQPARKGSWIKCIDRYPSKPGNYKVKREYSNGEEDAMYDGKFTNHQGYRVIEWYESNEHLVEQKEKDAVLFLEWVVRMYIRSAKKDEWLLKGSAHLPAITTEQLYNEWKQSNK